MIVFKQKTQNKIVEIIKARLAKSWRWLSKKQTIKIWAGVTILGLVLGLTVIQKLNLVTRLNSKVKDWRDTLVTGYYRLTVKPKESLLLDIAFKDVKKLQNKRNDALTKEVLIANDADLVPASIRYKEETIPVQVRLKGDWLDHLGGNKWSLRVEVDDDKTFQGMRRFSLQVPEARNFINEWVFLKVLAEEGLISLNYDFLKVTINGEAQGVYALEEHFSKEVIERNQKREGPILKFNADRFWLTVSKFGGKSRFSAREHLIDGYYFKSLVESFQQAQLESDPALAELLQLAINKLQAYREGRLKPSEVFDYELWSKYLVLADLFGADRGFSWENYRFYFNPITGLFEPIPYDNEPGEAIENLAIHQPDPDPLTAMFEDKEFVKLYVEKMNQYSNQGYLGEKLSHYAEEINYYTKLLKQDYPDYGFDPMNFYENADFMRQSSLIEEGLRATIEAGLISTNRLRVENLLKLPVEVLGVYDEKENNLLMGAPKTLEFSSTYELPPVEILELIRPIETSGIYRVKFRLLGQKDETSVRAVKVETTLLKPSDWPTKFGPEASGFISYSSDLKAYVIPAGNHSLSRLITIPAGAELYVAAGARIDSNNGGGIVSYSPVVFEGNEMEPIVMSSSDGQGQGLLIIGAEGKSQLNYTSFNNLRPVKQGDKTTSGAVTFYESELEMNEVSFLANQSEDQLNIVRSQFELKKTRMAQSMSDGLDVDFGQGKILDCSFAGMGNDAVDFSGSRIEIEGLMVDRAGDKGISVGERSQVKINEIKISNAKLGVASKDLSEVTLGDKIEFNNLDVGLAAYQKKPEYGPAYIVQDLIAANQVKTDFIIEVGSTLKQLETIIKGSEKNVGERFQ